MTIFCTEPVPQPVIDHFRRQADSYLLLGDFKNANEALDWLNDHHVVEMTYETGRVTAAGTVHDWAAIRLPGRRMAYARLLS